MPVQISKDDVYLQRDSKNALNKNTAKNKRRLVLCVQKAF
jgi:hypothetical protein